MGARDLVPPATLRGLFVDQQLGFLRFGLGIEVALEVLGPPESDRIFGSETHHLTWGSLDAGFREPNAAILDGAEPDPGVSEALTLLMLDPDPEGWRFPSGLRAQGWWPPLETSLTDFLDHPTLRDLSFDVCDGPDVVSVMFHRQVRGPVAGFFGGAKDRTLRRGDFRKRRMIETEWGSTFGPERSTQALFTAEAGFYRLLVSA
jgi:hypothetical protein